MMEVRSTFATEPILQNMKTQIFSKRILFLLFASWMCIGTLFSASRQMEYLDRGVVAVKVNNGVFISWRYLGTIFRGNLHRLTILFRKRNHRLKS